LKRLFLTLVFSAILLLSISVSQQTFANGPDPIPVECVLDAGSPDNRATNTNSHGLILNSAGTTIMITYSEIIDGVGAASQLAIFVLDPGTANAQSILLIGGSATATFMGVVGGPHTVVVCAGDTASNISLNSLEHIQSTGQFSITGCGDGVVTPPEQCEPPNTNICDASCQFIISSGGGQVEGETIVEPLCGLEKTVSGTDFTEDNNTPIVFPGPVINNQVTDPEVSAFFANTGSGPARVDITNVGDWLDEGLTFVFTGCNTKWSASPSAFAGMTSVCSLDPYIEILPAQTVIPSTFVERLHRVHATVPDSEFMITNLVTYTQVLELTVDCETPAQCTQFEFELNGECVPFSCRSNADCDDGNLCTDDSCESAICVFTSLGGASCNTRESGVCAAGTEICQGGTVSCEPNVGPSTEICDGLDNDCDGAADETFDLGNDRLNCGTCGNVCEGVSGQCVGGVCGPLLSSGPAVICACPGFIDNVFLCVDTCEPFPGGFCFDSGCSVDQSGQQQDFCDLVVECIRING